MEKRQTDNFQVLIDEARSEQKSSRWHAATGDLKRIHEDLPDVAATAAKYLVDTSPALAPRLASTSIREVGAFGDEKLTDQQFILTVRRTHRSVLLQESANQILQQRSGVRSASDFMSLKGAVKDSENHAGAVAIGALKKQGIDAQRLLGNMDDKSLRATSVGAYDRVGQEHRDKLINALEINLQGDAKSLEPSVKQDPVMRSPRTQFAQSRRQPSFGRRIAQEITPMEHDVRAMMSAGQGL
ncbi:MAG: hypothetical protein CL949_07925 [Erythrobacter sp.]|nr:hypothetical protein [Erythrobacter sp.]